MNEIEQGLLNRGLGEEFSSKIDELEKLVSVDIWKKLNFEPCNFDKRSIDEIQFANFSMNEAYHFAGRYFKKVVNDTDVRVWCGFHVPYGFQVSFWSADDSEKERFQKKIKEKKLNIQNFYSGAKIKGKIEGYWCSVRIEDLLKKNLHSCADELYKSVVDFAAWVVAK